MSAQILVGRAFNNRLAVQRLARDLALSLCSIVYAIQSNREINKNAWFMAKVGRLRIDT